MNWTDEMYLEVQALREETGEGLMWCKQVVLKEYAKKEKQEMENLLWCLDIDSDLRKILEYLIRKS